MTVFYNSISLKDTLIIHIEEKEITKIKNFSNDITLLYNREKIIGININNASEKIPNLKNGYIYLNDVLKSRIEKILGFNLPAKKNDLVIGKIVEIKPIENTHLNICQVDIGNNNIKQIVCGAKNARLNLISVVTLDNCMLPNGKIIKAGQLMGVKSDGMMCSYKELNIDNNTSGIIELNDEYKLGTPYNDVYSNLKFN